MCCLISALGSQALGGLMLVVDLDTTTAGIQTTRTVAAGNTFDADLLMLLTGGSEVTAFSFGIDFDPVNVSVGSANVSGRPAGFDNVNPVVIDNLIGQVRPFDALSFTSLTASSTLLGRLNITAGSPLVNTVTNI